MELQLQDFFLGKLILRDLEKVFKLWRVDLLVFCRNKYGCYTKNMQLWLLYLNLRQVAIYYIDSNIESLWLKAEFTMHIDDPLNQETSWGVSNFSLDLLNIFEVNHVRFLLLNHRLKDFLCIFGKVLWISHIKLVAQRHGLLNIFLVGINSFLDFFLQCISGLIARIRGYQDCGDTFVILTESAICWWRVWSNTIRARWLRGHDLLYKDGMKLLARVLWLVCG